MIFYNPIIPGYYPDPSTCRVGEDSYLVTSYCEFFSGVLVFHSKDLIPKGFLTGLDIYVII